MRKVVPCEPVLKVTIHSGCLFLIEMQTWVHISSPHCIQFIKLEQREFLYSALSLSLLCSSLIFCYRLSGTLAGSTLNGIANGFSSFCLVFKSWNLSPNAWRSSAHSSAYSDVIPGLCSCRVVKCRVPPFSSYTCRSFNFTSDDFTFESKELISRFALCFWWNSWCKQQLSFCCWASGNVHTFCLDVWYSGTHLNHLDCDWDESFLFWSMQLIPFASQPWFILWEGHLTFWKVAQICL